MTQKNNVRQLTEAESKIQEKYTFIKVPSADTADIKVGFKIGVQSFHLDFTPDSLEHAQWMRDMLAFALTNLIEKEKPC